ncbi:hypothetical protein [Chromobacterium alticapitis]|uniref:Uncharacterized protein n=1 Tax=Chromobacterium alticapitis TaxID=2073169 RepID=A0A2S5DHV6_9NEIS|nr:hypothetical protein [Chromobacterium alticapitis]POZ62663.1 hypothetical protein C2I19_07400 [Chromobacterium alticapitis]
MSISQTAQISLASAALLNGGTVPSPVVQNGNATAALASEAAQLAQESSAVVTLGGGVGDNFATYDATGLLNSFASAGTLQGAALSPDSGVSAQDSTNQQIVSQNLGGASGAGSDLNGDWATILKQNPALAGEAVADSFNGSIVDTIA